MQHQDRAGLLVGARTLFLGQSSLGPCPGGCESSPLVHINLQTGSTRFDGFKYNSGTLFSNATLYAEKAGVYGMRLRADVQPDSLVIKVWESHPAAQRLFYL